MNIIPTLFLNVLFQHFQDFDTVRKPEILDQYKSDTTLNKSSATAKRWSDRFDVVKSSSFDFDDTDDLDTGSDTTEIIYPPTDSDSDQFARYKFVLLHYKVYTFHKLRSQ